MPINALMGSAQKEISMSGLFGRSRGQSLDSTQLVRRLRSLEREISRLSDQAKSRGRAYTNDARDRMSATLADIYALTEQAGPYLDRAFRYGNDAARLSQDGLRRVSHEVEARPLASLAVALGAGFLLATLLRRRDR
jgi:ElaB/YqjD/DUF883 family membrane-anchored ribosome-binding protein